MRSGGGVEDSALAREGGVGSVGAAPLLWCAARTSPGYTSVVSHRAHRACSLC